MKYNIADHSPEQLEALELVKAWESPRFFDALMKEDNGRFTPAASAARLAITNGDGTLRPIHVISEMISNNTAFAQAVIEGDRYIRLMQKYPANVGGVLEQQHEILDSALGDKDAAAADKAAMHIRLINAVIAEAAHGTSPAAIAAQKEARRGDGIAL